MSSHSNCTCVVASGGTYLVDGEWTINPNVWVDVNGGLISDGHNRIVAPAGSGEQVFLNKTNHCWGSKGTKASIAGIHYGREAWVRCYVAAKADMSRWLAVEAASAESDDSGGLRCINLRVLDTGDELFAWRTPWSAIFGAFPEVVAAYDHEAHRLYFNWGRGTPGAYQLHLDPPDDPSAFGRFAGFGSYANSDQDVVFDQPQVTMFSNAVAEGCTRDCGTIEPGNYCDPLTSGMQAMYDEPEFTDCDQIVGWQLTTGSSGDWTLNDSGAYYFPPGSSCGGTAYRRIRVWDCDNSIAINMRTDERDESDDEPLASVAVYRGDWQGPGTAGYLEIFDPNTTEDLVVSNLPLGDCVLLFVVSRGDPISLPCHGVESARITVVLTGCSWMEPP